MFKNVPLIAARAALALGAGWTVVDGSKSQDRSALPRADVRLRGAAKSSSSGPGVVLAAGYVLTLCVKRSSSQFAQLDESCDALIAKLHNWRPEGAGYRLVLESIADVDFLDAELFGYEFTFSLIKQMDGCDED